ncbi:MAG: cytochrome b N-terminal domain-containing protein [Longimicrobiales bacterium]|nr:cytochrome b N-terminal domain-containing protein [Longimicrobiales bacterium]
MTQATRAVQRAVRATLARFDAWANALYTWRFNPLYHSGALVVAAFVVLLVTGLYLLLFYRIGAPWASVDRITGQAWTGRWIRSLHRYVSALAIAAALVHAFRMFAQGRTWGPRALAWVSGVVLLGVFLLCGWTGYVMLWDEQAYVLAAEGARLFDVLPIFSEPIGRAFAGERPMPAAFFFLNLFAHIALPVGVAMVLWIHVSRLARTYLMPPKGLLWGMIALFTAVSVLWPVGMAPEADLLRVPAEVPVDLFYAFWLPASRAMPPGWAWAAALTATGLALAVPLFTRPRRERMPLPSVVAERFCTGCEQCYHDCPYEAISMVPRTDGRDGWVARVEPAKCVSCGICAGSCAPMGVGPVGRTGRDQLADLRAFAARAAPSPADVVVVACGRGAGGSASEGSFMGAPVFEVSCAGSLHTSVLEVLVRAGWGGVLVASCPPRDCWNREGVTWLEERVYQGREAELKERVDRRRVRVAYAGEGELLRLAAELQAFRAAVADLDRASAEEDIFLDVACEAPEVSVAEEARQ